MDRDGPDGFDVSQNLREPYFEKWRFLSEKYYYRYCQTDTENDL